MDKQTATFSYSDKRTLFDQAENKISIRDIKSVKQDVVSMPKLVGSNIEYSEKDFKDKTNNVLHRGPNNASQGVLEVKTITG